MFVCSIVLYEYMNSLRNDVYNLFVNTHVRIKIYREFYRSIIYTANEERHVRIINFKHTNLCFWHAIYSLIFGKSNSNVEMSILINDLID